MKIKKFFEFNKNIDFYIFDFDDTLVEIPNNSKYWMWEKY